VYIWSSFSPAFETDTFWRGFLVTGLMTSPVHMYIGNINWTGQWPSSQWTCYSFCYNNNNNCTETWSIRKVTMSLQPDTQRKKGYKSTGRRRREDSLFMVRKNKRRRDSLQEAKAGSSGYFFSIDRWFSSVHHLYPSVLHTWCKIETQTYYSNFFFLTKTYYSN
jgi:hypothetical protein